MQNSCRAAFEININDLQGEKSPQNPRFVPLAVID